MKQLLPIPFITVGNKGLNKAESSHTDLGPDWALELRNAVYDDSGRIASRKGWLKSNATPITGSPTVVQMAELVKADGTVAVLSCANNKLWNGVVTPADVTGALAITNNNWQMVNFLDNMFGFQQGHTPFKWTGTGNAVAMTAASGALPTGNAGCAAFGRLWVVDADGFTIKYCGLLDDTNWGAAGSGSINMRSVWTKGTDTVQGIYAFGGKLAVYGKRHIIVFVDGAPGTNANIGLNPTTMVVSDTIEGTGLLGRDTVQSVGEGDNYYLSPTGVQSLARVIVNKNNPLESLDPQTREYVNGYAGLETPSAIRSLYSPADRFYLLILPAATRCFCYDTRKQNDDGTSRVTEWDHIAPFCGVTRVDKTVYMGFASGTIGFHTGYQDNLTGYTFTYTSPNMSVGPDYENKLKILKNIKSVLFTTATNTVTYSWGFDFAGVQNAANQSVAGGKIPEYGTAEYGANGVYNINDLTAGAGVNISEYAGGLSLRVISIPGSGSGRWVQVSISATINGSSFAVQELDAYVKIGNFR